MKPYSPTHKSTTTPKEKTTHSMAQPSKPQPILQPLFIPLPIRCNSLGRLDIGSIERFRTDEREAEE
jgi:hypothetical protein